MGVPGIPMFFSRDAVAALEYPPVTEQVKKRGKWLHEFSTQTLARLPGTPADPFGGTTVDINAMGGWRLAAPAQHAPVGSWRLQRVQGRTSGLSSGGGCRQQLA